ncbi:RagB/SusD family nutrient uptake outer membrane protein [Algivirga pacifica]|uniref:RagB/SusD family nutrient uptake outer membrane protein n=1 Tax=Algivirga pacifica TaxID=1162670 RepID=A0ABP9D1Z5_9BACT
MKGLNKYIVASFLAVASLSSCNLDVNPTDKVEVDNMDDIDAQVRGLFLLSNGVSYYGRNFALYGEIGTDNYVFRNGSRFLQEHRMEKHAAIGYSDSERNTYAQAFKVIVNANFIINNPEAQGDGRGQALFVRALAYSDLLKMYGPVPLVLDNTDVNDVETLYPTNATEEAIYTQIFADLAEAETLLTGTSKEFATVGAVQALKSRVYLEKGDLDMAIAEADKVINSRSYELTKPGDLFNYFNGVGGNETILEIKVTTDQNRGSNNFGSIPMSSVLGGYASYAANPDFVKSFDNELWGDPFTDARGTVEVVTGANKNVVSSMFLLEGEEKDGQMEVSSTAFIFPNKFRGQENVIGLHSPKVLRLSEVLLNKAEAIARQNSGAQEVKDIINEIRAARYIKPTIQAGETAEDFQVRLDAYNVALTSATGTLEEVLEEKRKEFAFEGHRSYDLRRNDLPVTVYKVVSETLETPVEGPLGTEKNTYSVEEVVTVEAGSEQFWFPIPESEQLANPNLKQNFAAYGE